MLRTTVVLLKVLFLSLFFIQSTYAANMKAPQFELPTASGKVHLSDFKGKVVYLDFWASWCSPCRKSFPWMNKMARLYGSKGLVVLAVNLDKDRDLAKRFLKDIPAKFTVAFDPEGTVADRYGVQAMPSSYLISRDGKLMQTHLGFRQDDVGEMERSLQKALR